MEKNIFLTGDIQIGKSTLVQKALQMLPETTPRGFCTVSVPDLPDGSISVYLFPFSGPRIPCDDCRVGIRRVKPCVPESFPEIFNLCGTKILEDALSGSLVIMDEIGWMECDACAYSSRIKEILDSPVPVLGVLQKTARTPLASSIRSHPNTVLLEVTAENRDALLPVLVSLVRSAAGF